VSSAGDRLRLRRQMGQKFSERDPALNRFRAKIGDGAGNVEVAGKHSTIYIRREGRSQVEEVLNVHVPQWNNLDVICGYEQENPDRLQVLRVDWGALPEGGNLTYLPNHHENHELLNPNGGMDVVWVDKGQVIPLAPFPTSPVSMQIWVQKDFYAYASTLNYWPGGLTIDFFATPTYLPHAYNGVYVTVSIAGASNALQYTPGIEFPTWPPPAEGVAIAPPPIGSVPIVAIYLSAGPNLLTNDPGLLTDSFETLDPAGPPPTFLYWSENLLGGAVAQDGTDCGDGGAFSCKITEGGAATNVYQDITVVPGENRQLRFWNYGDGANEGRYGIYDQTAPAPIVAITATGHSAASWLEVTQEYTVPAGCTTVRISFYCPVAGGSDAWFDGVTDAQVPSSLSWGALRDIRQLSGVMGGTLTPALGDWIGLNAANGVSWQPDTVAVLSAGVLTEYADPDDAFVAAVAGDVVLVPDGTWVLSASHALTSVDVAGIAGTRDGCILQANTDVGATLLTIDDGEISDVTVSYETDNAAARTALYLDATTAASYAFNVRVECTNDDGDAIALYIDNSYAFNCLTTADCNGANDAVGTYLYYSILERSRTYAYANAGNADGISVEDYGWARWCYVMGSAAGLGCGIHVQGSAEAWAYHCELVGLDNDINIEVLATLHVYSDEYDTVANLGTLTHDPGDRAGTGRNETITGVWTFDEAITQAEQAGDPGGPGADYGRTYPKDDAGQTKYYFQDDGGSVYEIAGIVEDLTVTVGGAGDFVTVQAAVDWFKNWIIKGACVIDCDADAYDEAVSFSELLIAPGATLTLEGDTRALPGISYVDGASCNQAAIANGGSGVVTLATNAGRDQITVTMTIGNPDFDADGIVNSDRILVYADDGNIYERVVNSIDPGGAGTNVIEITVALPAGATLGNDGTAICLLPSHSIERTAAGPCIQADGTGKIILDGWYLESSAGADCHGVHSVNGAHVECFNVAAYCEDSGFEAWTKTARIDCDDGACSAWGCAVGFSAVTTAQVAAQYAIAVDCDYGFQAYYFSYMFCTWSIAVNSATRGYHAIDFSFLMANRATARQCVTGYYGGGRGYINAGNTNANNNGNGADYNPAISDAWGNSNASITWS